VAIETGGAVCSVDGNGNASLITSDISKAENVTVISVAPTNLGSSGGSYLLQTIQI
jgi:hypothetical protein